VFGLPRRLRIDADELQRRFYELSRVHHPDFHQGASAEEQAGALEASARLNAAYRALRDPIARAEYLAELEDGRETRDGATVKPAAPPELLTEMFEIQEALGEARAGGLDDASRTALRSQRERLHERYRVEGARLAGELAEAWDRAPEGERGQVLAACRQALATRAYLRTVIEDLSAVLGEDEAIVSNRRH
jgi:molecular chaperone HscB